MISVRFNDRPPEEFDSNSYETNGNFFVIVMQEGDTMHRVIFPAASIMKVDVVQPR